jgi:hypothetical protein
VHGVAEIFHERATIVQDVYVASFPATITGSFMVIFIVSNPVLQDGKHVSKDFN